MLRPARMMRLSALVLERDERAALRRLAQLGAAHLISTKAGPDTAPLNPPDQAAALARCDRLLAQIEELRRSLGVAPAAPAAPPEISLDEAEAGLEGLRAPANGLLKCRLELQRRLGELNALDERLSSYRELEIPADELGRSPFLHFVMGSLPALNLDALQKGLGKTAVLLPLPEQKGRRALIALAGAGRRAALDEALRRAGFERAALPARGALTPAAISKESRLELDGAAKERDRIDGAIAALASEAREALSKFEALARAERRLLEAGRNFPRTRAAALLTAWIAADDAPAVERELRSAAGGRCVVELASPEGGPEGEIPVLLRPPWLLRPFAPLVAAYGLPGYQELEPTVFVAASYVLMFGMMFGDLGHGAVLALAGLAALLLGRSKKPRELGLLLSCVGLSSALFGLVYGSCFGIPSLKRYALWRDPLEGDPARLMAVAAGAGVALISLGLILNVVNRLLRGDRLGALLDKFGAAGLLFYWGALALLMKGAAIKARGLTGWWVLLFLVLPVACWALKDPLQCALGAPAEEGLAATLAESAVGAFEALIVYLANSISFVRLAAYAMSHAALLMAVFMLAGEARRFCGGASFPALLVVVLGNGAVIILEGVIAAVQALRLEYYEFFGKFFAGLGLPFKPFSLVEYPNQ